MDRQPVRLARQIPQRHVDAADRAHLNRTAPVAVAGFVHFPPQIFDARRILPDQERRKPVHLGHDDFGMIFEIGLAPTDQARIRVNAQPYPGRRDLQQLQADDFHTPQRSLLFIIRL